MLKIDDDEQTIGGVKFDDLLQFHVAKAICKEAIEEGKDLTEDELKELTQQSSFGVYPPSEGLGKAFDRLLTLREDQISYSIDLSGLIDELKEDIAEHEAFEDDELVVWAYWTILPNGREVYVDYYFQDDPEDDFDIRFEHDDFFDDFLDDEEDDDVKYIADFDKKMAEEYDIFARKLMPAKKLLKIFEEENRLF